MNLRYALSILTALALPLVFLGYGSDNDTYAVLDAGRATWLEGDPTMSRRPGYWLFEVLVLGLDRIGGFVATNLATLGVAFALAAWFVRFAQGLGAANVTLLTACLVTNPWFLIAASSTTDHMWALLASVIAVECLIKNSPGSGGLWAGIAGALRLGSLPTLAGAAVAKLAIERHLSAWNRWIFLAVPIAAVLLLAAYLPSWWLVGRDLSFLQGYLGDASMWSTKMHAGRFVYKTVYLFGLPGFLILCVVVLRRLASGSLATGLSPSALMLLGAALGNLVLFARYPLETFYLLPFLTFFWLLLGVWLKPSKRLLTILLVATASYSVVNFPLAKPNVAFGATDATIGLSFQKGILWKDIEDRLAVYDCKTQTCWQAQSRWVTERSSVP
jgi:hypothetical protein